MILMNALAFEAEWMQPYDKYSVGERTFTAADGTAETAEMMWSEEHTYLKTPHAVGFIKPYMEGYSFAAILPNEDISLSSYLADFDAEEYTALIESQKYTPVQAALPKFSYDFSDSLLKSLNAMGMVTAFGSDADLSGLTEDPAQELFISDVIHKTHIEVGEKGTRAGAVTAVLVNETAVMDPPEEVILDRPFLYAIIDNETQLPIFIGTVTSLEA
jgi:serpin B